ncbi:type II secretion system protein [Candidatus Dojkabacteria bacterium]|uniref:Type II secretion system protein n=1 Tax=Candidatus Dojkabacteria bacterium TaxID=2099670 RepID=A0A955L2E6_9BACT|nr:type II secretion system protein [Candidatus Dojkabacteria bacterium]
MINSYKKAFTLVELMIAMFVIGVLISLSIFAIQLVQTSVRNTQRLDAMNTLNLWMASYHIDNRTYPRQSEIILTPDAITFSKGSINEIIVELEGATTGANSTSTNSTRYCYQQLGGVEGATFKFAVELENGNIKEVGNANATCTSWMSL